MESHDGDEYKVLADIMESHDANEHKVLAGVMETHVEWNAMLVEVLLKLAVSLG